MPEFYVVKAGGERELFDAGKLERSLSEAGAAPQTVSAIMSHIAKEVHDGMRTQTIYSHAFRMLREMEHPSAVKYSLRRAIEELGPSGFPFEKFIVEVMRTKGYHAVSGSMIRGRCVEHEVDVVAWNDTELIMAEAKFHNELGLKSDLKVALYVKARMDDLRAVKHSFGGREREITEGVLITNTKFTGAAIEYATCAGLKLIGWNYPAKGNLHDMIGTSGLHPLTALASLSKGEKQMLLSRGYVLCKQIKNEATLLEAGVPQSSVAKVLEEIGVIC